MSKVTTAVILAGGLGTRLRSVVADLPKPMAPIAGRPFLARQMDYWIKQGITRFVLSVGYRHEAVSDFFGDRYNGAAVEYVIEEIPLGTGGGFLLASQTLPADQPFLLLNGDTYFAVTLPTLEDFAAQSRADWCFSLFPTDDMGRYMGMDVAPDGEIRALKSGAGRLGNGGVYWVHPKALAGLPYAAGAKVSLEDDIFPALLAAGKRLTGLAFTSTFIDIGIPADYHHAPDVMLSPLEKELP